MGLSDTALKIKITCCCRHWLVKVHVASLLQPWQLSIWCMWYFTSNMSHFWQWKWKFRSRTSNKQFTKLTTCKKVFPFTKYVMTLIFHNDYKKYNIYRLPLQPAYSERPKILERGSWTQAAPIKEKKHFRHVSDSIGNNYSPQARHLTVSYIYETTKQSKSWL
jgi:hypothetical protein